MTGDQHAVLGGDEIGFDDIRPHLDSELVGLERVLREITAGAAMGDHERRLARKGSLLGDGGPGQGRHHGRSDQKGRRFHHVLLKRAISARCSLRPSDIAACS
jgi:hypothetical protein